MQHVANDDDDDVDWRTRRRTFLREQTRSIRDNYSREWQRRLMMSVAGVEAKVRHRKVPAMDTSQPGVVYVGDRRFGGLSYFFFSTDHPLRRGAIRLITDP